MKMKSKLYLQIILLINYMTEENLFMQSGLLQSMLLHGFLSQKKKEKKERKKESTRERKRE